MRAKDANATEIFQDPNLDHTEWIRSAKTRVAETLFLERLLPTVQKLRTADDE